MPSSQKTERCYCILKLFLSQGNPPTCLRNVFVMSHANVILALSALTRLSQDGKPFEFYHLIV